MLQPAMHDSENGTHSASGAETLVLTANNLVYPEPTSTYYGVINNHHHLHHHHLHHHHHHHDNHHNYHHHPQSYYHNHNNNDHLEQHHHNTTHHPTTVDHQYHDTSQTPSLTSNQSTTAPSSTSTQQPENATQLSDPQNQNCTDLIDQSNSNDLSLFHNQDHNSTNEAISIDNTNDTTTATVYHTNSTLQQQPKNNENIVEHAELSNGDDDDGDDENENENEEEDDDDEDQDADGYDDDDEEEDEDDEDDDDVEDEDEVDESEDDSEGIVDPGQHSSQEQAQLINSNDIVADESCRNDEVRTEDDVLDGERMLEVTRKLVRLTERDPDRDLRKQVLLKTAIKKLPHFMDYNRYSDTLDRSFHSNMSPQVYYEHHDSQQKFYNSVQPNAIQMSTTGLRMLDLNDDHDSELVPINQNHSRQSLVYQNNNTSLYIEVSPMREYEQYNREHPSFGFHSTPRAPMLLDELEQHEPTPNSPLVRHNSLDNLYQPVNGSDMNEEVKDISNGDERIPLAFQIACEIYDFDCTSDDNEKKILENFTESYYTAKSTKESRTNNSPDEENDCNGEEINDARDTDGSDISSSSHSSISTSDDSANSLASQSIESDRVNGTTLTEASLNTSSEFYSSPDSGVALFPTSKKSNNKRSSSSIGLDDDMEIDHLTELSSRSSSFTSNNNQYKKLRKREIIE